MPCHSQIGRYGQYGQEKRVLDAHAHPACVGAIRYLAMGFRFKAGLISEKFFFRWTKRVDCVAAIKSTVQGGLAKWAKNLASVRVMGPAFEHIHAEWATAAGPGTPFDKDGTGHTLPEKWISLAFTLARLVVKARTIDSVMMREFSLQRML
jgi:hypothetical protein